MQSIADQYNVTLTPQQEKMLEGMFDYADRNQDGEVNAEELAASIEGGPSEDCVGLECLPKEELIALKEWAMSEVANDGTITRQEFIDKMVSVASSHNYTPTPKDQAQVVAMFDKADSDQNGEITAAELAATMEQG